MTTYDHYTYAVMKTMCPPGYHHNGFVTNHTLGHMMYEYTLLVPMNQRVLIYLYILVSVSLFISDWLLVLIKSYQFNFIFLDFTLTL